jgi:hypothetical protein
MWQNETQTHKKTKYPKLKMFQNPKILEHWCKNPQILDFNLGIMVHACNPSSQEAEAGL